MLNVIPFNRLADSSQSRQPDVQSLVAYRRSLASSAREGAVNIPWQQHLTTPNARQSLVHWHVCVVRCARAEASVLSDVQLQA